MACRRIPLILLLLALAIAPARAQPSNSEITTFPLLRFDASARAAGLGGAFVAGGNGDVNGFFYNPALSGPSTSRTVSVSYLNHLSDINVGTVVYSHTVRPLGTTFSGGLRFVHWGTFDGRNGSGERTGSFVPGDAALTVGASRSLGSRARYGANVHVLHAWIEEDQSTVVAADFGGVYRLPRHRFALGAMLRHLGGTVSGFEGELPMDLQVGVSKGLAHLPVLLSLTAYDLTRLDEGIKGGSTVDHVLAHLAFGGEVLLGDALRLRAGYNHRRSSELAFTDRFDLAGLTGGFGLELGGVAVDYAYVSWSDLGGLHQLTVQADLTAL